MTCQRPFYRTFSSVHWVLTTLWGFPLQLSLNMIYFNSKLGSELPNNEWVHQTNPGSGKWLLDGVNANNCDPVSRYNAVTEVSVAVQLDVSWHFAIRNSFGCFLQLQQLEVDTATLLRNDKEWVNRTLGSPSLIAVTHPHVETRLLEQKEIHRWKVWLGKTIAVDLTQ